MRTDWDYSDRARTYDERADYSKKAVTDLLNYIGCPADQMVADIGAGTGKLTRVLLDYGLKVRAIEPNDNMRSYGIKNTIGRNVTWTEGTGEDTRLNSHSVYATFYGSSFNVVDHDLALKEVERILNTSGWLCCMWNHRDINDPIQKDIESIIKSHISDYDYGSRRQDPTSIIKSSKCFSTVNHIEERFEITMSKSQIVNAWRSHETLFRQSLGKFEQIISEIAGFLTESHYQVPYFTRIWFSQNQI